METWIPALGSLVRKGQPLIMRLPFEAGDSIRLRVRPAVGAASFYRAGYLREYISLGGVDVLYRSHALAYSEWQLISFDKAVKFLVLSSPSHLPISFIEIYKLQGQPDVDEPEAIEIGILATDYQSRVFAAGGLISNSAVLAVNEFFYQEFSDGQGDTLSVSSFSSKFKLLWFPLTDFDGVLVPLLGSDLINHGVSAGQWDIRSGVSFYGTEWLESAVVPDRDLTQNDTCLGVWVSVAPSGYGAYELGCKTESSNEGSFDLSWICDSQGRTQSTMYKHNSGRLKVVPSYVVGFRFGNRESATSHKLLENGVEIVSNSLSEGIMPDVAITIGGRNIGTSVVSTTDATISCVVVGDSLNSQESIVLYNALLHLISQRMAL